MTGPYVSVVVTTRNDNYGENMRQRLDMFISGLDYHQQQNPGLFELVIVEWNPPGDQPPLKSILPQCSHLPIRVITVSSQYHPRACKGPMSEYLAKNVGLRRSRGKFVLVTNPDILFSNHLVKALASQELQTDVIYRCDRYDFKGDGIDQIDPSKYLEYAVPKIFRLHGMSGQKSLTVDIDLSKDIKAIPVSSYEEHTLHTNAAGDFMLLSRDTAIKAGGLYQGNDCVGHGDSASMIWFNKQKLMQGIFRFPCVILHHDHGRDDRPAWNPDHIIKTVENYSCADWGLDGVDLPEEDIHAG